jgi:hypothetical protein
MVERYDEGVGIFTQRALPQVALNSAWCNSARADFTGGMSPGGWLEKDHWNISSDLRGCFCAG